jgi:hypothetical protein
MLKTPLALITGLAGAAFFAAQAYAGSLAPAPAGTGAESLLQYVHGCHAVGQWDRFGHHYHARGCARVDQPPPGRRRSYERSPYCWQDCKYIGPIKTCETRCRGDY